MADPDVVEAEDAVNELYDETVEIWQQYQNSLKELNDKFRNIDGAFNKQRRQKKKLHSIESLLKDLKSNASISLKSKENEEKMDKISDKMESTKKMIVNLGKSKRKTGSMFLRFIIGHVSVKLWNEGERLQFKQEYNRFKETWVPMFIVFPLVQLYFGFSLAVHQLYSFFAFYYYISLAIRENILNVNGSNIDKWWIYHHYVTVIAGICFLLVSEDHPLITHHVAWITNVNLLWQASVMLVQNNYQRQRHYTRKALGKKKPMHIRTTEVIDENVCYFLFCYLL